jgi:hypothetical protein
METYVLDTNIIIHAFSDLTEENNKLDKAQPSERANSSSQHIMPARNRIIRAATLGVIVIPQTVIKELRVFIENTKDPIQKEQLEEGMEMLRDLTEPRPSQIPSKKQIQDQELIIVEAYKIASHFVEEKDEYQHKAQRFIEKTDSPKIKKKIINNKRILTSPNYETEMNRAEVLLVKKNQTDDQKLRKQALKAFRKIEMPEIIPDLEIFYEAVRLNATVLTNDIDFRFFAAGAQKNNIPAPKLERGDTFNTKTTSLILLKQHLKLAIGKLAEERTPRF